MARPDNGNGMKVLVPALLCALVLGAAVTAPALAKDVPMRVLLDGRPLDASTPSGLLHRGVAFINVVRATKTFNGLLTFGKDDKSVTVTIGAKRARFVIGQLHATVGDESTDLVAPPFTLNGDTYVPLASFAMLAGVKLQVDTKKAVARLTSAGSK